MNLIIDQGNTLTKLAVFDQGNLVNRIVLEAFNSQVILELLHNYPIRAAIVSDVRGTGEPFTQLLSPHAYCLCLKADTPLPLKLDYDTPQTLGSDRIAASLGAWSHFPGQDILVIQAGTCLTYDLVTSDFTYRGGAIAPGLEMRFKALHTFTAKLPLLNKKDIYFLNGKNTRDSILSGVINGSVAELDGIIERYQQNHPNLKVVMTGGDTFFFDKKLKNRIFAIDNLVLTGLNLILEHNARPFNETI